MKAIGQNILVMIPTRQAQTDGGILLTDQAKVHSFYGLVISIGEGVQEKYALLTELPVEVGDIVHFDPAGMRRYELATLQGEIDRIGIIHYSQITSRLDDVAIARLKLYDFAKEKELLAAGSTEDLYAARR